MARCYKNYKSRTEIRKKLEKLTHNLSHFKSRVNLETNNLYVFIRKSLAYISAV